MGKAYAQESQAFVIRCISAWTKSGIDVLGVKDDPLSGKPSNGISAVFAPDSRQITPDDNPHENLLVVDLDLSLITMVKQVADTSRHCELSPSDGTHRYRMLTCSQTRDRTCCG